MSYIETVTVQASEYMESAGFGAWLIFDYQGMNPVFQYVVGGVRNVTRPCYVLITPRNSALVLAHHVDIGRFGDRGFVLQSYTTRDDMVLKLGSLLRNINGPVAMEYSPMGALPRASRIDAGTLELVRSLGPEVISSADLFQYATQRWSSKQLASHQRSASALVEIVQNAFRYIGMNLVNGITEHDVAEHIRTEYITHGLVAGDGPVVAVDAHSSDPHYEPLQSNSERLRKNQWVLIDLWAKEPQPDGMFADITWVGFIGSHVPDQHQHIFEVVCRARDEALLFVEKRFIEGRSIEGWEVDKVARATIDQAGYGEYFTHRLGHSLGAEVHGDAVNLDNHETHDNRKLLPNLAVTIEPGIYLPEFGMRSEIDVYLSEEGPVVTTTIQRDVVLIES